MAVKIPQGMSVVVEIISVVDPQVIRCPEPFNTLSPHDCVRIYHLDYLPSRLSTYLDYLPSRQGLLFHNASSIAYPHNVYFTPFFRVTHAGMALALALALARPHRYGASSSAGSVTDELWRAVRRLRVEFLEQQVQLYLGPSDVQPSRPNKC